MGLKEDSRRLRLPHIDFVYLVVVINRLYWSVNILVIDVVLEEKYFHSYILKVTFCFCLIHARLSILEIYSLTLKDI